MGNAVYNELRKAKEAKEIIPQTLNPQPADYLENYVNTSDINYPQEIENQDGYKREGSCTVSRI